MKRNIWKVVSRTTECFLREEKEPPKPDKEKCQRILADLRTIFTLHGLKVESQVRLPERSDKPSTYGRIEAILTKGLKKTQVVVVVLASTEGVKITCKLDQASTQAVFKKDVYINTIRFVEGCIGV